MVTCLVWSQKSYLISVDKLKSLFKHLNQGLKDDYSICGAHLSLAFTEQRKPVFYQIFILIIKTGYCIWYVFCFHESVNSLLCKISEINIMISFYNYSLCHKLFNNNRGDLTVLQHSGICPCSIDIDNLGIFQKSFWLH